MKRFFLSILILAAALPLQARKVDRGLGDPKAVYIEKGTWQLGFSGGYKTYGAEGLGETAGTSLYGIVNDLSGQAKMWNASASGAWFFANNVAVGVRFGYEQSDVDIDSGNILSFVSLQNRHIDGMHYTGDLFCRAYIPLFNSKIFALYGEGSLGGKRGYSKDYAETDRGKLGTYSDDFSFALKMSSGLSVFVNDVCAISFTLPFLQIGKTWSNQIKEGEPSSKRSQVTADYKPDFLGLSIGVSYNF
ncbi:MAG: hypothetical protein IKX45_01485 [Bacteroidales bacterium]|nr:hypothetical protein [Bacteroidales bacterium]